jgi:Flp pilus assembly protein TadB
MRRPYIDPSELTRLRMLGLTSSGSGLRASDAERERAAETLRRHHADGRLTTEELEERTARAYAATTRGDLDQLFGDLPRLRTPEEEQPHRRSLPLPAFAFPILALLLVAAVVSSAHFLWLVWPLMIFLFFRFAILRRGYGWRSRSWPDPWRRD